MKKIKRQQTSRRQRSQASDPQQAPAPRPPYETQVLNMEIAQALARFLFASDWITACSIVQQHPILLLHAAAEVLVSGVADARMRGDELDECILHSHLAFLERVRTRGVPAVLGELRQSP